MALYRTDAIVLKTRNFGEADRVILLFSDEHGKFEAVVKGARRQRSRFVGNTLAFNLIRTMLMSGKNLDTLSQAELVHSFSELREDLTKLAYASFWVELIDSFIPEKQEARDVFKFLLAAFVVLEKTDNPVILNLAFEIRLLHYLGYQPQLDNCVCCGNPLAEKLGFSAQAGGVICLSCHGNYRDLINVNLQDLDLLNQLAQIDLRQIGSFGMEQHQIKLMKQILRDFIEARLDHPLKSQIFLDNISE